MVDVTSLRAVIADDHPMLLQGLNDTLTRGGLDVIGAASDGSTALKMIIDYQPDLAVLDIEMPYLTGFAIAEECQKKKLSTKFIILSYHKEAEFITQAKSLNISGYLLKEDTSTDIFNCIQKVMEGEFYFSPSISDQDINSSNDSVQRMSILSPSEKKILKMIATQLSSQEIAEKLYVSERTIEKHRSNIIAKLNLAGQANSLSLWALDKKTIIMGL